MRDARCHSSYNTFDFDASRRRRLCVTFCNSSRAAGTSRQSTPRPWTAHARETRKGDADTDVEAIVGARARRARARREGRVDGDREA